MEKNQRVYGLFNDSFPPVYDGVTMTVLNYAYWLTHMGKPTCVVTPWNPGTPAHEGYDLYRYFSLPIASRRPYRYGYPRIDWHIWPQMRKVPFALVHAHCPFSSGRLAAYAARKQGVPLVATFHSKYRTDLLHSLPKPMVKHIMNKVMRFFDGADEVWIPQAKVEETVREYGYRGPLTVVDNGIDLDLDPSIDIKTFKAAQRERLGYEPDTLAMIFVGQHIREKGVMLIIEAIDRLRDLPVRMDFIGTGYAAAEMEALINRLGLADKVKLHGVVSNRDELKARYAAADLFLFPSRYDNAPLVVREAAVMSTPAMLIEGSTAAEVIVDGHNGFLCEATPESYADKIRTLLTDRQSIDRAGRGAQLTLTRSWQDVMEEVVERYNSLISRYECKHR